MLRTSAFLLFGLATGNVDALETAKTILQTDKVSVVVVNSLKMHIRVSDLSVQAGIGNIDTCVKAAKGTLGLTNHNKQPKTAFSLGCVDDIGWNGINFIWNPSVTSKEVTLEIIDMAGAGSDKRVIAARHAVFMSHEEFQTLYSALLKSKEIIEESHRGIDEIERLQCREAATPPRKAN